MGGSEGVMQVADYGEIQFETWLNSSYGIWKNMLPNSFKKWWLRSPGTNIYDVSYAWDVISSGVVDVGGNRVGISYGRTSSRRARVILSVRFSSLFPVTPASTMVVLILSTFPTGLSA